MTSKRIDGLTAWNTLVQQKETRWTHDTARFGDSLARVAHAAKFELGAQMSFFCMGSCFARNIEEHLIYSGADVSSRMIVSPAEEWSARANGFVNKFTTASMLAELDFLLERPTFDETYFEQTAAGWIDLQLCPGVRPVDLSRAIERREYLTGHYFDRLRDADVVILTLGLVEVWEDCGSGRFLNTAPSLASARREPDRYRLHILDARDNTAALDNIYSRLKAINPIAKVVTTVSPVPMTETFSGRDVLVANTYSKSVLRAAAETFANAHDDVDYFPSYDMIASSPRATAYAGDCVHVTDAVVGEVVQIFLREYLGVEVQMHDFSELSYLAANPDVEAAVRRAEYASGYHHWNARGAGEGRPLRPQGGPTHTMIVAGVV